LFDRATSDSGDSDEAQEPPNRDGLRFRNRSSGRVRLNVGNRRLKTESRLGRMSFGEEDVHRIRFAILESAERPGGQSHVLARSTVDPSQIDGQVSVDVNPQIVVAGETQGLTVMKGEQRVALECEVEVVERITFVATQFTVDRKKVLVVVLE